MAGDALQVKGLILPSTMALIAISFPRMSRGVPVSVRSVLLIAFQFLKSGKKAIPLGRHRLGSACGRRRSTGDIANPQPRHWAAPRAHRAPPKANGSSEFPCDLALRRFGMQIRVARERRRADLKLVQAFKQDRVPPCRKLGIGGNGAIRGLDANSRAVNL